MSKAISLKYKILEKWNLIYFVTSQKKVQCRKTRKIYDREIGNEIKGEKKKEHKCLIQIVKASGSIYKLGLPDKIQKAQLNLKFM